MEHVIRGGRLNDMSPRVSARLSLFLTALLLVGGCGGGADQPNVILLVMDAARGDHCSINGYDRPTTPALEDLARGGVNFRNAWSPSGWTAPAHASLLQYRTKT